MTTTNTTAVEQVDVRGPRFTAWITTVVIVATLVAASVSNALAAVIIALQAIVFAIGALAGPRKHPYGRIFAKFIQPRLAPVTEREPVPPLKFAFAVVAAVGFASGLGGLGLVATAFALIAAFLNAAFGICLGCMLYPLVARLRRVPSQT
jgi:hypothetical protein